MALNWDDPQLLADYCIGPRGAGIYIIGRPIDPGKSITACDDYDAYLGSWPDNMKPVYVGISQSTGAGVRGRLSCHARKKEGQQKDRRADPRGRAALVCGSEWH